MLSAPAAKLDPFAPPCPKCKEPLDGIEIGEGDGSCEACATPLEYATFPALRRPRPVARAVRSIDGDATCFFHAQNQAAAVCDDCGRYLCVVCEVPSEDARRLCPPCVSGQRKKNRQKADEIVTYDTLSLTLALLPPLLIVTLGFTLITAPAAVTVAIIGLRKPRSLVRRGTVHLVVAMILGLLQIGGWIVLFASIWLAD